VIRHIIRSHKTTKDVTTRIFDRPNAFGGQAPPRPDGQLKRSPGPLATIGKRGPTSKGKEEKKGGREREGKKSGREGERKGRRKGMGKKREGEGISDCLLFI